VGLSLEAAPFSLTQNLQVVSNEVKDYRSDRKHSFRLDLSQIIEGND